MERKNIIPQAGVEWEKNDAKQARYAAYVKRIRRMGMRESGGKTAGKTEGNGGKAL